MDSSQDFGSSQEKVQRALVAATRTVNALANEDLSFQRTANPAIAQQLDQKSERLLRLSNLVLRSAGKATGHHTPSLEEADDIDTFYKPIVDVIDSLLEKADTCLDEYTGLIKRRDAPTAESSSTSKKPKASSGPLDWSVRRANITKPQTKFDNKPNNYDNGPWKPLLTEKPHAVVPLEGSLSTFVDENEDIQYKHPYETEILNMKYPGPVYQIREPVRYLPVESTAATWVDTYEGVLEMLEELKEATEIAVDLEHHDWRTYTGLLSLMQISTREKDWVVDTLKPWRRRLEVLNLVFADPAIVKVFHGAAMDIIWLQRDLGLYIVGLFDTHHASDALGYPGKSLAYLLKRFVDFDADKKYQLADWRIRPLPEEMFYYARCDTHFLLYVYDMVRNELVERSDRSVPEKDLIEWVLQRSKETSLSRYSIVVYDPDTGQGPRGWYNTLVKSPALYSKEQFAVYRAVHKWRDDMARSTDESPFYIMSQQVLADIARLMPSDPKALWSLLHNAHSARSSIDDLFSLIQDAREDGATGPSMMDIFRSEAVGFVAKRVFGDLSSRRLEDPDRAVPSAKELRSEHSQLWGSVALSSVWDHEKGNSRLSNGQEIALPWTSLVQPGLPSFEDHAQDQDGPETQPAVLLPDTENEPGEQNPEFTLRAGRKRDISQVADDSESSSSEESGLASKSGSDTHPSEGVDASAIGKDEYMDLDVGTPETGGFAEETKKGKRKSKKPAPKSKTKPERRERRVRKAGSKEDMGGRDASPAKDLEKKASKAAKRAARKATGQTGSQAGNADPPGDAPFDYSKAQSVLHAKRASAGGSGVSLFDPYTAKTQSAPPGAKKTNYEKAGKTATFKR